MTPANPPASPVAHLDATLRASAHRNAFDMVDSAEELALLAPFPVLRDALVFLGTAVAVPWRDADEKANRHQQRHTRLARTAVATGTGAIVLAVVQLGLKQSWPALTAVAGLLEFITVVAGVASVFMGHWARSDRKWLQYRHQAERLRMLKFRALASPDLWNGSVAPWREQVTSEVKDIHATDDFRKTEEWSGRDQPESAVPTAVGAAAPLEVRQALVTYYLGKRLRYQQAYFASKGAKARKHWTVRWRGYRGWLFVATIGCVLFHFGADWAAGWTEQQALNEAARAWAVASLWGIVCAAVLPVIGIGVRAWSAAFELSRKARSFAAKDDAMGKASQQLGTGTEELSVILHHMAHDELFLEQEHREWLRLLLDAEWFL